MEVNGIETTEEVRYDSLQLSPEIMGVLEQKADVGIGRIKHILARGILQSLNLRIRHEPCHILNTVVGKRYKDFIFRNHQRPLDQHAISGQKSQLLLFSHSFKLVLKSHGLI